MTIKICCMGCGKRYAVKDELAGKKAKCTACGTAIPIPLDPPSHGSMAGESAVSQPRRSSGDVLQAGDESGIAPSPDAGPGPPPLPENTTNIAREPSPRFTPPSVADLGVPPSAPESGLVLLPRRSNGLIVMAVLNCLKGAWGIFSFVSLLVMGEAPPWLMHLSGLLLSVLLVVSGIGYYQQKQVLGWRVGNAYGCLGVLRYFLLVKQVGWYSYLWFSMWLIYPLLTLVMLNSVLRTQFPGPPAGRKPIIPAHWSLWRRAQILLACGLLVYLITPGGAFLAGPGQWYSGSSPESDSAQEPPVNPFDVMGMTALHTAASQGLLDDVRELLDKGADVNARSKWEGYTPLQAAAEANSYHVVELLLARKAEVNVKDNFGRTPLHSVAKGGSLDIARLLLDKGAEVNATDVAGDTPMHAGAAAGQEPIVLLLLSKGANVNAKNQLGTTPLDYAERNPTMLDLLRKNGATPGRPAL
jgi:hypothetical protein